LKADLDLPPTYGEYLPEAPLYVALQGNAEWLDPSVDKRSPNTNFKGNARSPHDKQSRRLSNTNTGEDLKVVALSSGGAFDFEVTGPGPISVSVVGIMAPSIGVTALVTPNVITINTGSVSNGSPPIAKLRLVPTKAYRRYGEAITVTALAVDEDNTPVKGAKVAITVVGDCDPSATKEVATTNESGVATLIVEGRKPGTATVVAMGVDINGGPVLSDPAHIVFFVERRHQHDDGERGRRPR
jgi:hypothetical protein